MNRLQIFEELSEVFPSLIPLNGKKPIEPDWTLYCEESRFFNPKDFKGHNAGIFSGPANGIIVIDVDDPAKFEATCKAKGWDLPPTRRHQTGSGNPHIFYQYPRNGHRYGNRSFKDFGFDIRGIGGQVVAPGSIHPDTGKPYKVLWELDIVEAPNWVLDLATQEEMSLPPINKPDDSPPFDIEALPYPIQNLIRKGEEKEKRSEAQFSVLNACDRAGLSDSQVIEIFEKYPIGEKFREKGRNRNTWLLKQYNKVKTNESGANTQRILDYVDSLEGKFTTREAYDDLGLRTPKEKNYARVVLNRLNKDGIIERWKNEAGAWRKVQAEVERMDLVSADYETVDLWLPLNVHKFVNLMPGNIVTITGDQNTGKTAFLLNVARENVNRFKIHYFSSEMGPQEMRSRIDLFDDFPITHENFNAYERHDDFADVIQPGKGNLNIIDYLELVQDFWIVGKHLKDIHHKLNGAVAVVALQKRHPDSDDALGGKRSLEKPRLALSMSTNKIKIIKGKNWRTKQNPNHLACGFKLVQGSKFIRDSEWKLDKDK